VTATLRISPLGVVLDLSSATVPLGKTVQATATVTNWSSAAVRAVAVELRLDPAGLTVKPVGTREIRQIKGARQAAVSWTVCAASLGTYVLLAQATVNGDTVESAARILTVTGTGRKSC
jgi:hypothetical protein